MTDLTITGYRSACAGAIRAAVTAHTIEAITVYEDLRYAFRTPSAIGRDKTLNIGLSRERFGDWADGDEHFAGFELYAELFVKVAASSDYATAEAFAAGIVQGLRAILENVTNTAGLSAWEVEYLDVEQDGTNYVVAALLWRSTQG